jgi:hypothetical protein
LFSGAAIFFEFKHYKVEKHKWSTKCWAFLEREVWVRVLCLHYSLRALIGNVVSHGMVLPEVEV